MMLRYSMVVAMLVGACTPESSTAVYLELSPAVEGQRDLSSCFSAPLAAGDVLEIEAAAMDGAPCTETAGKLSCVRGDSTVAVFWRDGESALVVQSTGSCSVAFTGAPL